MKLFAAILSMLMLVACGGGDTQIFVGPPVKTLNAIFPHPVQNASTVLGSTEIAIHTYQALYGQAPGYTQLSGFMNQIGTSNGFTWAASMAASFNGLSDSDFSTLILNNMSITPTSLTTTAFFGTGRQAYDALQAALADYLRAAGIANRGTVVVQMAELLSNMEVDTTFGVYGAAATSFNKQASANLAYSTNAANTVASVVVDGVGAIPTASAEGIWVGITSKGTTVNLAILENGETWGLYGSSNLLTGAVYGTTTTNGATLSGSGTGFNFVTRTSGTGTFTGSVTTKGSISFNVSDGTKLTGTYDASYDQSASLANLAGTYTGGAVTGTIAPQATTVTVGVNGNIYSSFVSGNLSCTTSGTATPRATGKNVFNVQLSFTGNYCALGNGTVVNGVATYNTTIRQIIMMGMNSAKADGLIYIGTR